MAVAYMLAWPYGTPRVMSSYRFSDPEQGPPMDTLGNIRTVAFDNAGACSNGWVCEHRRRPIYKMVTFRNIVDGEYLKTEQRTMPEYMIKFNSKQIMLKKDPNIKKQYKNI